MRGDTNFKGSDSSGLSVYYYSVVVSSTLYLIDDDQFLYTLLCDLPRIMDSSEDYVDMFKLRLARYISKTYKLFFSN